MTGRFGIEPRLNILNAHKVNNLWGGRNQQQIDMEQELQYSPQPQRTQLTLIQGMEPAPRLSVWR